MATKKKKQPKKKYNFKALSILVAAAVIAAVAGFILAMNTNTNKAIINYEDSEVKATITVGDQKIEKVESGQGSAGDEVEVYKADGEDIPTVESVDSDGLQVKAEDETPTECPEGEECGQGAAYPYVNTNTPQAFLNATLGGCYDVDGYYDEQCWDYAALFFLNYAGHTFYTCGTGAAKGAIADGCWQKNAGNEFEMVWDARQLQAGDWVVFNNGQYGHVGMATGSYNNGYVTLAGQNQGGGLCAGSTMGAKVNLINISTKYFAGAFRPKTYIVPKPTPAPTPKPTPTPTPKPTPAPTPTPTPSSNTGNNTSTTDRCKEWTLKWGDTLGKIMLTCEGRVQWGAAMDAYAQTWVDKETGKVVFDGWNTYPGIGLYAGHTVVRK